MIDEAALREGLKKLLAATESDIRARVEEEPELKQALEARHKDAAEAGRAAPGAWLAFRDEAVTQAAVHWLLGCVFVRFLEDNDLVDEVWIAGPKTEGRDRLNEALDRRSLWYRQNPHGNDADYLLDVFSRTAALPGMAGLFDRAHNPLWSLSPSGQQAMAILQFFQMRGGATSELCHDFTDPNWNTRFLGDLYQNLSEFARKRYALCQTPGFVVDFILDRTLTPALDVFGLEQTRLIDPTCGSGHFLLAAFDRLFAAWVWRVGADIPSVLAQRALDALYGVDLNPFAVAIAEFRLLIAALSVCCIERLRNAPNFRFQLAAGDSLLHGPPLRGESAIQRPTGQDPAECYFAAEDADALRRILGQQYHAVVGNPPYINVADPALRETYRRRYTSCAGKYQLSVPFTERFFHLALRGGDTADQPAGLVGLIVSNAFMKRSFGKRLIENHIRFWDLTHVIDTSGVYLPGHGTPTAILIGRNRSPVDGTVRAVRGIRGETGVPDDPTHAPVWSAIVGQVDHPGSESKWVSVADARRELFGSWPWSTGGGGAAELNEALEEAAPTRLATLTNEIGLFGVTGENDIFVLQPEDAVRYGIEGWRHLLDGESIREWSAAAPNAAVWPYDCDLRPRALSELPRLARYLWPSRSLLAKRKKFGTPITERGMCWYEWQELYTSKLSSPIAITFGDVATHNHFMLTRGEVVLNRHAPVIKLSADATEHEHLRYLALLNSSVACFRLKQVCFPKGGDIVGDDGARVRKILWDVYYEFDNTRLRSFPVPAEGLLKFGIALQSEADARSALSADRICAAQTPTVRALTDAREHAAAHLARMIALQEELDWQVYHLYGLLDEDLSLPPDEVPPLKLGERPFEIIMARQMAAGELETTWFERHGSTPITELPAHWPERYRRAVERRLEIIATNHDIALVEQPEYKRRWNLPKWEDLEQKALENWLLDRMESTTLWSEPELRSCSRLADLLRRDSEFTGVAELAEGHQDYDIAALVKRLALKQAVPFLSVLRYKPSGLEKRREWEKMWDAQRREDAGEQVKIDIPPKYRSSDFQDATWWSLRGSLDVPKERFILYSGIEGDSDSSPVIGWAGWNHLQQAEALNAYYRHAKEDEAWPVERLKPALAGLLELIPWLKQWHNEPDSATGDRMGDSFAAFLEAECQGLGITVDSLQEWTPTRTARAGRRRG
jgi:hypothetical protein